MRNLISNFLSFNRLIPGQDTTPLWLFKNFFLTYLGLVFFNHNSLHYVPVPNIDAGLAITGLFSFLPTEFFTRIPHETFRWCWLGCLLLSFYGPQERIMLIVSFFLTLFHLGFGTNYSWDLFGVKIPLMMFAILIFSPCTSLSQRNKNSIEISTLALRLTIGWYFFSAFFMKMVADGPATWVSGESLMYILQKIPQQTLISEGLQQWPWLVGVTSTLVIIMEMSSPLAILNQKIALIFCALWITFHLGVGLTLGAHYFFYWHIPCFAIFLPWDLIWEKIVPSFKTVFVKKSDL